MKDETFISRWSRRKSESKTGPAEPPAAAVPAQATPAAGPVGPTADVVPAQAGTQAAQPLPPIESLTFDSDFSAFMKPDVDPALRREALKTLLQDPRFNVMDGLDTYIDDYSKPDPLPDGWLEKLNMVKRLGIFTEPTEDAPAQPAEGALEAPAEAEKVLHEHPVVEAAPDSLPDTSSNGNPPSEVGKT